MTSWIAVRWPLLVILCLVVAGCSGLSTFAPTTSTNHQASADATTRTVADAARGGVKPLFNPCGPNPCSEDNTDPVPPYCGDICDVEVAYNPPNWGGEHSCVGRFPQCIPIILFEPVAIEPGKPNGKCTQTDGQDSLPIGATLGAVNVDGQMQTRSIVDVNQINTINNLQVVNSNAVAEGYGPVGWIYLDNMGGRWFQKDPATNWSASLSVNIASWLGFGVNIPNWSTPQYINNGKAGVDNLVSSNDFQVTKCFTQGVNLS